MTNINRLPTILITSNRSNNLSHNSTSNLKTLRSLNHLTIHNSTIIKHIPYVYKTTIKYWLNKIISIMKMQNTFLMSLTNLLRKKNSLSKITRNLSSNIIPLSRSNSRILIRIFLIKLLIFILNQTKNRLIRSITLPNKSPIITIYNISLSKIKLLYIHKLLFNNILNILNQNPLLI